MTTTVTTTTVTTVSAMGLTLTLGVVATLALVGLLLAKELAGASSDHRVVRWSKVLNIGITPLLLSFAVILAVKVASLV